MADAMNEGTRWRVGKQVPINVYEGDRPVCQCHTALDAKRIVEAVNAYFNFHEQIVAAAKKAKDNG